MKYFCPNCFAELSEDTQMCPQCGTDISAWMSSHSYFDRLIKALKHPVSEVRMGAIISLGNQENPKAAQPLADCASAWPNDTVQALEIMNSILKLPDSSEKQKALQQLQHHPANVVRKQVTEKLNQ